MRIAIVINTSWNIYHYRQGLIRTLIEKGHEVIAFAPRDAYSDKLQHIGCKYVAVPMDNKGSNPVSDILLTIRLYKLYKKWSPDVVLHFTIKPNIYGTLAARLARVRSINNVSGLGTVFIHSGWVSIIAQLLYKLVFRFPQRIFFQNEEDATLFLDRKLVQKDKVRIIPGSGIDVSRYTVSPYYKPSPFSFVLIARLLYDKGIVEYAEAARLIREAGFKYRFLLVGFFDGKNALTLPKEKIDKWVQEGIIEFVGAVEDATNVIATSGCVVLPSYREGTPRTLLEALALAKPVIGTDVPGCREVVKHGYNGWLCTVRDPLSLAVAMKTAAETDENTLKKLGLQGRQLAEDKFDEKIVIQNYLQEILQ